MGEHPTEGSGHDPLPFTLGPLHRSSDTGLTPEERSRLEEFSKSQGIPLEETRCATLTDPLGKPVGVLLIVDLQRLRAIALRNPRLARVGDPEFEMGPEGYPLAATVRVFKTEGGRTVARTAFWHEHAPQGIRGEELETWMKAPGKMLAEVAEAMALRSAFPAELAGIYTRWDLEEAIRDHQVARAWTPLEPASPKEP